MSSVNTRRTLPKRYYPIATPLAAISAETVETIRGNPAVWAWTARAVANRMLPDLERTPPDYFIVETEPAVALPPEEFHRRYREHHGSLQ